MWKPDFVLPVLFPSALHNVGSLQAQYILKRNMCGYVCIAFSLPLNLTSCHSSSSPWLRQSDNCQVTNERAGIEHEYTGQKNNSSLGRTKQQDSVRVHHATQNRMGIKTCELLSLGFSI